MNKILFTTLVALLFVCATVQAQIKDTYQEQSNGGITTIVVKEDTANDMDILNDQFDLDDVGMHQVIRITTRQEAPPQVTTDVSPPDDNINIQSTTESTTIASEAPILTASIESAPKKIVESPVVSSVKSVAEEPIEMDQKEKVIAAAAPTVTAEPVGKTTTKRNSRSSNYTAAKRKSNKRQFKIFNRKFKKQKRKRIPRKRKRNKRCYSF